MRTREPLSKDSYGTPGERLSFNDINYSNCLILLGEAGMGKSTTLEKECKKLEVNDEQKLLVDLFRYANPARLNRFIFQNPEFVKAQKTDQEFYLFLDSFDECHALNPDLHLTLGDLLKESITLLPSLKLRLACRSGPFPSSLKEELENIFQAENVKTYELLPLSRQNIIEACEAQSVDFEAFVAEIERQRVWPYTEIPLTLIHMLKIFARDKRLPKRQTDLFETLTRELLREQNIKRIDTHDERLKGKIDEDCRLKAAEYIASASIFTNRPFILLNGAETPFHRNELAITELVKNTKIIGHSKINVTPSVPIRVRQWLCENLVYNSRA